MVERNHQGSFESLCEHHDRSIRRPEGKVTIALHQIRYEWPLVVQWRFDFEESEVSQKLGLHGGAKVTADKVSDLRDNKCRNDEVKVPSLEHGKRALMVLVAGVESGEEWTCVNYRDQASTR